MAAVVPRRRLMDCPICLDFYSDSPNEDYFVSTNCGVPRNTRHITAHVFHYRCLCQSVQSQEGWFSCPMCRYRNNFGQTLSRLHDIEVLPRPGVNVFDHELKIVVLGKFKSGKSSIIRRFARNVFSEVYNITENVDYFAKNIQLGDKRIKLNLWDTAGQEQHKALVSQYVRNAFGMIFVYDITDRSTFNDIENWIIFANDYGPTFTKRILVGNKLDLENIREVPTGEAQEFARNNQYSFLECSAKEATNIPAIFRTVSTEMLNEPRLLRDADQLLTDAALTRQRFQELPFAEKVKYTCNCN